jgi:hypothetical protein
LAVALGAAIAAAVWAALALDDRGADPNRAVVGAPGFCAALFCVIALWKLAQVSGTTIAIVWPIVWLALAIASRCALVAVAFATRLTG